MDTRKDLLDRGENMVFPGPSLPPNQGPIYAWSANKQMGEIVNLSQR